MSLLEKSFNRIHEQMQAALIKAGRQHEQVQLIAVSKTKPIEMVREAIKIGQRHFGENRVQEAITKFPLLRQECEGLELHLIGPLQTNKVELAVDHFDVIQTLDRPRLAEALAKAMAKKHRKPRLYVEVNIGREQQKAGLMPEQVHSFIKLCRDDYGLSIGGLMCIPPQHMDPTPYFTSMRILAHQQKLEHLSMGMSADFETAIACGATEIRVGSALFGDRPTA